MTKPDWGKIHDLLTECARSGVFPNLTPMQIEDLVLLHGWSVIGDLLAAVQEENTLRALVDAGVPFDEAIKVSHGAKERPFNV